MKFRAELFAHLIESEFLQQFLYRLGAHLRLKRVLGILIHLPRFAIFVLHQQLLLVEPAVARVGDDVRRKVEYLFENARREIEDQPHSRRNALEIPNVRNGRGKLDMPHALPTNLRASDFDAATLTDFTFETNALVLAAMTLPIARRSENAFAKQTVAFGLERAIVDGLGFFDFAMRPRADLFRRRQPDPHRIKNVDI